MEEPQQSRGVENPHVVDLVTDDPEAGEVVLVMLEKRPWSDDPAQLRQVEEKFNSYLDYVLGGHLARQYPQYEGLRVRFQLECAENPRPADRAFFTAVENFAASEGIRWVMRALPTVPE